MTLEVDAREMERDGFYGQTAVLLLITSFFALIQSILDVVAQEAKRTEGQVSLGIVADTVMRQAPVNLILTSVTNLSQFVLGFSAHPTTT